MNKTVSIVVGLLVIGAVGWFVVGQQKAAAPMQPEAPSQASSTTSPVVEASASNAEVGAPATTPGAPTTGISAAQVAQHAGRESCWSIINGAVYDLTSWIPKHPGGEAAILKLCGSDGSARFNAKHGGNEKQVLLLAGFKIGMLAP